jgi:lysophospholipase L1-like esterase
MSDYSHSRKNFAESIWRFKLNDIIPDIPLKLFNYWKINCIFHDVRNSLTDLISRGKINVELDYSLGLKVYERNIQNIIHIAKKNNSKVIVCTFAVFLYDQLKKDPLHILYKKIVDKENQIIKNLSKKNKIQLADCDLLIPRNKKYFLDSIHLSKEGMEYLAKLVEPLIKI